MKFGKMMGLLIGTGLLASTAAIASPEIPICGGRSAMSGPVAVCLEKRGDGAVLNVGYRGYLCPSVGQKPLVFLLQNGTLKDSAPLWEYRVGCGAVISLDRIHSGELEIFLAADHDRFDSNYGRNYRFVLRKN